MLRVQTSSTLGVRERLEQLPLDQWGGSGGFWSCQPIGCSGPEISCFLLLMMLRPSNPSGDGRS
uniref:Uncharacterized protein n=1 Tax=Anguilla anguilla TaxID=7936 RepID=A0A0E9XIN6_ANGAN